MFHTIANCMDLCCTVGLDHLQTTLLLVCHLISSTPNPMADTVRPRGDHLLWSNLETRKLSIYQMWVFWITHTADCLTCEWLINQLLIKVMLHVPHMHHIVTAAHYTCTW